MEITTTSDMEAFVRPCALAFGVPVPAGSVESMEKILDASRAHVAREGGAIVGAAGAFSHHLAVPGGVVAAAAIFGVGVLPTHRRRGILTLLQQAQLTDAQSRGEALAYLWASDGAIYGRYGYGTASRTMRVTVQTNTGKLRGCQHRAGGIRLLEQGEVYQKVSSIYDQVWKQYPGMFSRSEQWWRITRLGDPNLYCVVWEDSAYALYLVKMDTATLSGEIEVIESLSVSVEGHRNIWSYLLGMDLMRTVSASTLPIDHPLVLMLEDPQSISAQLRRGLWVRIIDVEAALQARSLGAGSAVLQVRDPLLRHNDGNWRVTAGDVSRVDAPPDLIVDIGDLGSIYLGGFSCSDLVRSGRVHERVPGSIDKIDRLFSWSCKPWCPQQF
jgi:predicted acetyltransferase